MHEPKHDPLNPDSEQQLYEKLAMSDADREQLEFIRRSMRSLLKQEKHDSTQKTDSNMDF